MAVVSPRQEVRRPDEREQLGSMVKGLARVTELP
jgi:hypothetical protein